MKYRFSYLYVLLLLFVALGCQREDLQIQGQKPTIEDIGVFGDQIKIRFGASAPDPILVNTKAVDPDGIGVQTMTLFCFNEQGLFISTATAELQMNPENSEAGGIFDAFIPNTTKVIHLVGNQNMTPFKEDDFRQKSEDEVMSILEGSAGMMVYWARVQIPADVQDLYSTNASTQRSEAQAILDWITIETNPESVIHSTGEQGKNKPIRLLRNQAKFTVTTGSSANVVADESNWSSEFFKVTGFTVCNTQAFGTVAPYNSIGGFPTYECSTFEPSYGIENWVNESFVSLPVNKEKLSDIMDVSTSRELYVFETENGSADPVDVIIKGMNIVNGTEQMEMYYKVNVTNADGEQVPIRRNHHYQINITGNLSYGSASFGEALDAPATNNIWLSISDEVNTVLNEEYKLTVVQTSVVVNNNDILPGNTTLDLGFSVEAVGTGVTIDPAKLSIQWIDNEQKVSNTHNPDLVIGSKVNFTDTGKGKITIGLNTLDNSTEISEGTLLVKYASLQRKIKIVIVKTQSFVPAWVSTEVYGAVTGDTESRQNVTLMFTIPESCPDELLPLDVLISVNGLDIRSESGIVLPIVRKGEEGYGEDNEIGYKFKYTITEKGTQRVYFENVLQEADGATKNITIEALNFETLNKTMTFTSDDKYLKVDGMLSYNIAGSSSEAFETVNYILVPQKRYAPVIFDLSTVKSTAGAEEPISLTVNDEFLLYSGNLDHYRDNDYRVEDLVNEFDCSFKAYEQSLWGTGGRVFGFYPRETTIGKSQFSIFMETNTAKSAEVVRIASNKIGLKSVIYPEANYNGQKFRSVTFEMANYRPFRFAAQVNGDGAYVNDNDLEPGSTPADEAISYIEFPYHAVQSELDKVQISFDITSFAYNSTTSVDPFGTGFEIFIDAPSLMLYPGDNPAIEGKMVDMFEKNADGTLPTSIAKKPKLESLGNGRFVYRVDPVRATEASFWRGTTPLIEDTSTPDVAQAGERKTIVFRTNQIVSSGDITISSNEDHVVYHSKTFRVSNSPITGIITYGEENTPVPEGQFVSFSRVYNGSRIGSMSVGEDGAYELRLRKEYEFSWLNDPMQVMVSIGGVYYSATITDLDALSKTPSIHLTLAVEE